MMNYVEVEPSSDLQSLWAVKESDGEIKLYGGKPEYNDKMGIWSGEEIGVIYDMSLIPEIRGLKNNIVTPVILSDPFGRRTCGYID